MITPSARPHPAACSTPSTGRSGTIAAELGVHHDTVAARRRGRRASSTSALPRHGRRCSTRTRLRPQMTLERASAAPRHAPLRDDPGRAATRARSSSSAVTCARPPVAAPRRSSGSRRCPASRRRSTGALRQDRASARPSAPLSCFVHGAVVVARASTRASSLDQTLESFLRGHVAAFEALRRRAARRCSTTTSRASCSSAHGDAIRFHPRLLELAGHYHFAPKPCAPYRGNEKGKVERTIRYLRDSLLRRAPLPLRRRPQRAARRVARRRRARAARRPATPTSARVVDALAEERARLLPLPEHRLRVRRRARRRARARRRTSASTSTTTRSRTRS